MVDSLSCCDAGLPRKAVPVPARAIDVADDNSTFWGGFSGFFAFHTSKIFLKTIKIRI